MTTVWYVLYGATLLASLLAVALSIAGIVSRRALEAGRWATIAGAVTASGGFVARWYLAGHPAIFGTFENTYALATALLVSSAVASMRGGRWRAVWRWAVPWALVSLLYGTRFRQEPVPLTISEQSLWVDVHVAFAWTAFVALLAATSASIVRRCGGVPLGMESEETDRVIGECLMAGYAAMTVMLAIGAWYGFLLFGMFWQWSTVEIVSLVAWLGYAVVIHGRLFYRWEGRRLDIGVLCMLPVLVGAYFIWSFLPDVWHYFEFPLVKPY